MGFLSILFDWLKGRIAESLAGINLAIELAVAVLKDRGE